MTAQAVACRASVEVRAGRYQFVPVCGCGWTWRGYVAEHAARTMVEAHEAGEV